MANKEKKTRGEYVTRKVVESRIDNIYELKDGKINLLGQETTEGTRISKTAMQEKYNVKNVVIENVSEKVEVYGVKVDEFMKIAKKINE